MSILNGECEFCFLITTSCAKVNIKEPTLNMRWTSLISCVHIDSTKFLKINALLIFIFLHSLSMTQHERKHLFNPQHNTP